MWFAFSSHFFRLLHCFFPQDPFPFLFFFSLFFPTPSPLSLHLPTHFHIFPLPPSETLHLLHFIFFFSLFPFHLPLIRPSFLFSFPFFISSFPLSSFLVSRSSPLCSIFFSLFVNRRNHDRIVQFVNHDFIVLRICLTTES